MGEKMDEKVKSFARKLRAGFDVQRIILFGSRARGDWLKASDYDFIIVSNDFEGMHFLDRPVRVMLKTGAYFASDLLCYTPKEFAHKKKQIGIVSQALKEGITV